MALKFTSDKATLSSVIQPALYATSNKSTLPALEGLLFKLEGNVLTVSGYDLEKGIQTSAVVYGREDGAVVLNSAKISGIIKNFPECDITFEGDEKNLVIIKGGESEFAIHGIDASVFPAMPELKGENKMKIKGGIIKDLIYSTGHAVASADSRPLLSGVLFSLENGNLTVVSTDNFRLALREIRNCVEAESQNYIFIVPGKALNDLAKLITDNDEDVYIEFTRKYVIFRSVDIILFSRLLEGEFLDYKRVIPKTGKTSVKINRLAFIESVERASLIVDEKMRTALRFKFSGQMLNISCETQYGRVNENIGIELTGDDIEIGFNNRYILDALRASRDDEVMLTMSSPLMSMTITPVKDEENSSYVYLVLPMRF
ncbi:MAG: DNA polymerase III subunit beta [Clostridiales bacterium]|jgi:DNA polymerase-3 subunit beta|nr:DNA polymerase III subunit beta [Clostridiales bacterium]